MLSIGRKLTGATIEFSQINQGPHDAFEAFWADCISDADGNASFVIEGANTILKELRISPEPSGDLQPTDLFNFSMTHKWGPRTITGPSDANLSNAADKIISFPSTAVGAINEATGDDLTRGIIVGPITISLSGLGAGNRVVVGLVGRRA